MPHRVHGRPAIAAVVGLLTFAATAAAASTATASAAAAASASTTAAAASANTAATPKYWVSATATSTSNTSCATAAYATVQSAVTAAEAYESAHHKVVPAIEICPGTYSEQLTINASLVLSRANVPASQGPAVIQLPAAVGNGQNPGVAATYCQDDDAATGTLMPQSVIQICAARPGGANTTGVAVSVSHLTVQGNWLFTSCAVNMYGILVEGGASLSLADSIVAQIGDFPLQGCQSGVDIEGGSSVTHQIGHLTLTGDTIESYQKNGIVVDGPGSTGKISGVTVTGGGPTRAIAQNGIQISLGATGSVTRSKITANNYTGSGEASAAGILVFGGGGKVCGIGSNSPLVRRASFTGDTLINNDVGIALFNVNSGCNKSVRTPTRIVACRNSIRNTHGYRGGVASADANVSGYVTARHRAIGDQAGISDSGDRDVICHNWISGAGYAQRDRTRTLPNPAAPAWVRPIDLFSFAPPVRPDVYRNKFDGKAYTPH